MSVSEILEKALEGERIDDEEAVTLLRSRDLVAVGRTAHAMRNRKHDPDRVSHVTLIVIDRQHFHQSGRKRERPGDRIELGQRQRSGGESESQHGKPPVHRVTSGPGRRG